MARLPFIPSSYTGRSTAFESQRLINLYAELSTGANTKGVGMLIGVPGKRLFSSGLAASARSAIVFNGLLYVVQSNKLVSIDTTGKITVVGTLNTSFGRVSMSENGVLSAGIGGNQICIVDGLNGYVYNILTGAFTVLASIPALQATASLNVVSSSIQSITVTNRGSGYTQAAPPTATLSEVVGDPALLQVNLGYKIASITWTGIATTTGIPVVTITDPTGTGASFVIITAGGIIGSITVFTAGHGYTNPVVTVSNVSGGAVFTAHLDLTQGEVVSVGVTHGGSGYTAPNVIFSTGAAAATATLSTKSITGVNVISGGSGYLAPPIVTIQGAGGTTQATATVVNTTITAINITGGGTGYTSTPTITISSPEGMTFPTTPLHVEFIDGYFILTNGTMNTFASNLYDGTLWNTLATTPVEAVSDNVQNLINLHQQLFFIKEYTSEVFYNNQTSTATGFPYSRLQGAVIDFGTPAPWSVARGNNSIFFLANERDGNSSCFVGVVELNGYTPTPITPPSIVYRMSQSTDHSQCFGYCYSDEGHSFYVVTNPVDNWTFVYDTTTQMWHERSTCYLDNININRDRANVYVRFNEMHIVGDSHTGNLYEVSSKFNTDAGLPIISTETTQHLIDNNSLDDVFIDELQIDIESGVGLDDVSSPATAFSVLTGSGVSAVGITYNGADYTTAPTVILQSVNGVGSGAAAVATVLQGSVISVAVTNAGSGYTAPPQVIFAVAEVTPYAGLSRSKDGGKTWGAESIRSMGNIGEYRKRLLWRSVGRSKDIVFRLRISSPVKRIIMGWFVEVSK